MSSQMEILSNKFNSLLTQYKDTYQNFVNTITSNNNSFTSVDNSAFVGEKNINTIKNSSVKNCSTSCSTNKSCSGATFDDIQKTCTLSSGNGNIINSKNQTAIVKQALYYSNQLQKINNELINTNNSMMSLVTKNADIYKETKQMSSEKSKILQNNYNTLESERMEIGEIVREYETLNTAYENGNINVTSNYYTYIVYLFISIFLVLLLLRFTFTGQQRGGGASRYFSTSSWLIIFLSIFVIILNAYMKN
jgi:hypothetical protein